LAADRSWTLATGAGVVVAVVAGLAGNRATASETADGASFAAAYPGVIGVAATDAKNVVTEDSIHGEHVSLAAPGYSVVTAFRDWGDCVYGTQGQSSSFATGHVSAAAATAAPALHRQESAAQITCSSSRSRPRGPSGMRVTTRPAGA
jgi:membrane-anchored mycosin MYCP